MIDLFTSGIAFLFMVAIVYGSLEFSDILKSSKAKVLIAISIGLFVMMSPQAVTFISEFLPYAAILFAVVFFVGFLTGGRKDKDGKGGGPDYQLLGVVILLVALLLSSPLYGQFISPQIPIPDNDFLALAGVIVVFLIIAFAYKSQGKE